jgi:RHS repeat-associated protein
MTGNRILRQQNGATTIYVGDAELTLKSQSLSVIRYYTHQSQTIAARTANTNAAVTGLIPDWQGTTHLQINTTTGGLTIEWHDPYGQPLGKTGVNWIGERGFVGGTQDETGLTRIGARDYDPTLGTFITTDPIHSTQNRIMMNVYGYAGSNPTTYSDPTGRQMYIADCPGFTKSGGPLGPPAPPPKPADIAEHIVKNGLPQTVSDLTKAYGSVRKASSSIDWFAVWTEVNALYAAQSPYKSAINRAVSQRAGDRAMEFMLKQEGWTCYWDQVYTLTVCYGGDPDLEDQGGITIGHTFISFKRDGEGNSDPRDIEDARGYANLMEHERNHALQWDYFGKEMVNLFAVTIYDYYTGPPYGCTNPIEISANLWNGGYRSCA